MHQIDCECETESKPASKHNASELCPENRLYSAGFRDVTLTWLNSKSELILTRVGVLYNRYFIIISSLVDKHETIDISSLYDRIINSNLVWQIKVLTSLSNQICGSRESFRIIFVCVLVCDRAKSLVIINSVKIRRTWLFFRLSLYRDLLPPVVEPVE